MTASPPPEFGRTLRRERERAGLSLREAARRIGVSPAYLVSIEQGRNPSTGRAPMPSAPVLIAIQRTLGVDVRALLGAALDGQEGNRHVLVVQLGAADGRPPRTALRTIEPDVECWIDVAARRRTASSSPPAVLADLPPLVARAPAGARVGLVFGAGRDVLGESDQPAAMIAAEATWEHDVDAVCRHAAAAPPAVDVCVFRAMHLRAAARKIDPVRSAVELIRAHPRVLAQLPDGRLAEGEPAIGAILGAVRPRSVGDGAWDALVGAAAAGLSRERSL